MENGKILFDKYAKEMEADVYIDGTILADKQYSLPNVRHKWMFRLVQCKRSLYELYKAKDQLVAIKIKDEPIALSKPKLKNKMEDDVDIQLITDEIKEYELLIEYLELSVNKNLTSMGFDIKNLVELIKMEQL